MIKRLALLFIPFTLLFSCYQDLSTTADKEFPEIQITGVPDMLETFYGEEIALHAVATLGGEAYDGFDYAWAIDLKPGDSRDRIDISETTDIAYRVANQPNETPYCLSFTATDRESGLSKVVFCQVYVRSSLGEGILVAHTRDNGQTTDFDLLANKYVTYGYTSDVPRYTRDIYQLANGQPVNGKVNAVLPVVRTDGAVYNENLILVGTDEHLLALDPLTFKVAKQDGALFNGYKEPTFEVHNLINYGKEGYTWEYNDEGKVQPGRPPTYSRPPTSATRMRFSRAISPSSTRRKANSTICTRSSPVTAVSPW